MRKVFLFLLLFSAFASAATVTIDSVSYNPSTFVEDQTVTLSVVTKETSASDNASVTLSVSLSSGLQFADTGLSTATKTYTISSGQTSTQTFQIKAVGSGTQTITTTLSSTATVQKSSDLQSVCAQPKSCVLSLSASSDQSSVVEGGTFTVSGTVASCVCNYEAANTQVTLSASPSSRVSISSATKSLGSVTTSSAANWLVTASSAGTVVLTVTASADSPTVSDSRQVSVTISASSGTPGSPGSPGGGSSGGAVAAAEGVKETKTIASIAPGVPATLALSKDGLSVSEIRLEVNSAVSNVSVTVEKLDAKPSSIPTTPVAEGKVYKYLSFTSTVPPASIGKVKIKFKVENYWISSNNFSASTVYLNRYSAGWSRLPTVFLSSDSKYSYFEAESPGFSTFAVTGEKPAPAAVEAPAQETPAPPAEEPAEVSPTPSGLAPVVSLVTQSDLDRTLGFVDSVVPQTDDAKALLETARLRLSEAQSAFNNGEQAKAKRLLDEAKALADEAAGLRSASVSRGKTSIFTVLLIIVVLVIGAYAYFTRPAPREDAANLARLKKERETVVRMKKNAEKEYLSRKIDPETYKKLLSDYDSKLVEVNTRIDGLSKKDN